MYRFRICGMCLVTLLGVDVAWSQAEPQQSPALPSEDAPRVIEAPESPQPDLSVLESQVADQLREARDSLDRLRSQDTSATELADAWGNLGKLYQAYEISDAAEHCYREAASLAPQVFQWHYYLARLYQAGGRQQDAREHYRNARQVQPDSTLTLVRLGEVQLELGEVEAAKQDLLQALYLQPGAIAILARLGEIALAENRYQLAATYLSAVVERKPEANRLNYLLAMAYRGLGQEEEARAFLERQGPVGIQPPDPWLGQLQELLRGERSHLIRGKLAYQAGQFEAAASAFREAVAAKEGSARAHINLGSTLALLGQIEKALEEFRIALDLHPDNFTARFNLGQLLLLGGSTAEAAQHLRRAVERNPEDAEAHLYLARASQKLGRVEDALAHYRESVRLDPTLEDAWARGPQLLVDQGRYADAIDVLEKGYARLPHSLRIANALARVLAGVPEYDLRDGARALELALRVYAAEPSGINAATVAMAVAETGACQDAVAWQLRALAEMPEASDGPSPLQVTMKGLLEHYQGVKPCRHP